MTDGLSLLELADLPPTWRAIIRLLMRRQPQTTIALSAALAERPGQQPMSSDQLESVLADLCQEGYVVRQVVDGAPSFRMCMARKSGRAVSGSLWSALEPDAEQTPKPTEPRRPRKNVWDSLG